MQKTIIILLFLIAPGALAQEVVVPEDSMRDAWSDNQQEFDSLSSDYGGYSNDSYGYSGLEDNRSNETGRDSHYDSSRRFEDEDSVNIERYEIDSGQY